VSNKSAALSDSKLQIGVDDIDIREVISNDNISNDKTVSNDQPSGNLLISEHQMNIVNLLLSGGNVIEYAASNHLMLAIEIDAINEALYDEIGDTVIEFDGDTPELVEDYIDDIKQILGIR
jgi:hypothetical protein